MEGWEGEGRDGKEREGKGKGVEGGERIRERGGRCRLGYLSRGPELRYWARTDGLQTRRCITASPKYFMTDDH